MKELITQEVLMQRGENQVVMPSTKIDAFFEEFPWVRKYVKGSITQVYVSRIVPEIVGRHLHSKYFGEGYYEIEQAWLLDASGNLVKTIIDKRVECRRYVLFGPKISTRKTIEITGEVDPGESISHRLYHLLEKAGDVDTILSYYDKIKAVIVYKSPRGLSVKQWIEKQIEAERTAISHTIEEINAEAK